MDDLPRLSEAERRALEDWLARDGGQSRLDRLSIAGARLAEVATELVGGDAAGRQIILLAGPGRNGAVGLDAARRLHEDGATVRLVIPGNVDGLGAMAAHFYRQAGDAGLKAWGLGMSEMEMADQPPIPWTEADLIVDALIGAGLQGEPRGEIAELVRLVNSTRRPILSFDRPTGLGGDEGTIYSPCIDATATLTMTLPGRVHHEGWAVVGDLWLADPGLPPERYEALGVERERLFGERPVHCLGGRRAWRRPS